MFDVVVLRCATVRKTRQHKYEGNDHFGGNRQSGTGSWFPFLKKNTVEEGEERIERYRSIKMCSDRHQHQIKQGTKTNSNVTSQVSSPQQDNEPDTTKWSSQQTSQSVTFLHNVSGLLIVRFCTVEEAVGPPQLNPLLVSDDSCMKTCWRSSWLRAAERNLPAASAGLCRKHSSAKPRDLFCGSERQKRTAND